MRKAESSRLKVETVRSKKMISQSIMMWTPKAKSLLPVRRQSPNVWLSVRMTALDGGASLYEREELLFRQRTRFLPLYLQAVVGQSFFFYN
jgi:hypothetical protein